MSNLLDAKNLMEKKKKKFLKPDVLDKKEEPKMKKRSVKERREAMYGKGKE